VKRALIALVAAAALIPAALASAGSVPVLHPGELIVGLGGSAPGFANGKQRGDTFVNPSGYEVDLAKAIANDLKLKVVWRYTEWSSLFQPGAKNWDINLQEATITAQRKKVVDFSSSYLNSNQGVLLSKKAPAVHSIADLKKLQTCAQTDTTGLQWIQQKLRPSKAPLIYQTTTAAFTAVSVGKCQAIILDVPIVELQVKATPGQFGKVAGQIVTHEQYGIVLPKNSKLTPVVDSVLAKLTKNGTIAKLQKKWFNVNFAKIPVLK
jgi:polar amino acid transport system substrate-binding protein